MEEGQAEFKEKYLRKPNDKKDAFGLLRFYSVVFSVLSRQDRQCFKQRKCHITHC